MKFDYPIVDIHTHLRNQIPKHTRLAKKAGLDTIVYMANCSPPLDNISAIKKSLKETRFCKALPVSALTKNLEGKELVNIDEIKPYVVGFSDDGVYLEDLSLLKEALGKDVLVLAHCSPKYEIGVKNPELETRYIEDYLKMFKATGGKLHIQHISKKESVELIRKAKKEGSTITCETCPYYFTYTKDDLNVKVNPPLATKEDVLAIQEGLKDGAIDVIASDYAPEPRKTGVDDFTSLLKLSSKLVFDSVLTERQLEEKLSVNTRKIIDISV